MAKAKGEKMVLISVHLPKRIMKKIEEMAVETGKNKSTLIREALSKFLNEPIPQSPRCMEIDVSPGQLLQGVSFELTCANGHVVALVPIHEKVAMVEKAKLIGELGLRCPRCKEPMKYIVVRAQ